MSAINNTYEAMKNDASLRGGITEIRDKYVGTNDKNAAYTEFAQFAQSKGYDISVDQVKASSAAVMQKRELGETELEKISGGAEPDCGWAPFSCFICEAFGYCLGIIPT